MRTRSKLLLASLAAALLLATAVGSSSARRLSITNRQVRMTWREVNMIGGEAGASILCPLTLEGSFHSFTVHKVVRALVGYVTRATIVGSACTGGRASINQEALPWHVAYGGFSGTLPNITLVFVEMIGAKVTVEASGQTCTTQTTQAHPDGGRVIVEASGGMRELQADETRRIPLRGNFFCSMAGESEMAGTARVTLLGNTTIISIRLI